MSVYLVEDFVRFPLAFPAESGRPCSVVDVGRKDAAKQGFSGFPTPWPASRPVGCLTSIRVPPRAIVGTFPLIEKPNIHGRKKLGACQSLNRSTTFLFSSLPCFELRHPRNNSAIGGVSSVKSQPDAVSTLPDFDTD